MRRLVLISGVVCCLAVGLGLFGVVRYLQHRVEARREAAERARQATYPETQITIIEGLTNAEVFASLAAQKIGTVEGYRTALERVAAAKYPFLGSKPKQQDVQGYLFPDTYRVSSAASEDDVLALLLDTFGTRFAKAASDAVMDMHGRYQIPGYASLQLQEGKEPGLTIHELVTLASIVEKESGSGQAASSAELLAERRTIAGIFLNRLAIGMALQSDATVNYVTKSGRASATQTDIETDSPYNTYKYRGLPPGPIANISYSSLYAVLHPLVTDYLYFLHSQSTGDVYYAKTFEEHTRNKAKYLR